MPPDQVIVLDETSVRAQIAAAGDALDQAQVRLKEATRQVLYEYMVELVGEAQSRAAVRSGNLRRAATVLDPVVTATWITCEGGFNLGYARQRDQGGEIRAVRGRMLSIPLDPIMTGRGVARYSSPREESGLFLLKLWGRVFLAKKRGKTDRTIELHWLLKDSVNQKGDGYFKDVVEARKATAGQEIGARIATKMSGGAPL